MQKSMILLRQLHISNSKLTHYLKVKASDKVSGSFKEEGSKVTGITVVRECEGQ